MSAKKKMAEHVIKELSERNMEGVYFETGKEAAEFVCGFVKPDETAAFGGSDTIAALGISEKLRDQGVRLIDYPETESKEIGSLCYKEVVGADYFFMSTNAVTLNGELVNIDGASNRLSCLLHGPKHVVIVCGVNKIVKTVEDGIDRIRTQVCPVIGEKAGRKIPCALTGVCTDCKAKECMCCNIVVTRYSRYPGRIQIVFVGETVGI